MISEHNRDRLEEIIQEESFDDVQFWALEHFDLYAQEAVEEAREEGHQDGLFAARKEANDNVPIDPLAVINSALAHGQIGRVPWALVERGGGLVLAIGGENIPIDTPAEMEGVRQIAEALAHEYRHWAFKEPR